MEEFNYIKANVLKLPDWIFTEKDNNALNSRHFYSPNYGNWNIFFKKCASNEINETERSLYIKFFQLISKIIFALSDSRNYPEKLIPINSYLKLNSKTCSYYISIIQENKENTNEILEKTNLIYKNELQTKNTSEIIIIKNTANENLTTCIELVGELEASFLKNAVDEIENEFKLDRQKIFKYTFPSNYYDFINNKDQFHFFDIVEKTILKKTKECIGGLIVSSENAIKYFGINENNVICKIIKTSDGIVIHSSQEKDAYFTLCFILWIMRANFYFLETKTKQDIVQTIKLITEDDCGWSIKGSAGVFVFEIVRISGNSINFNIQSTNNGFYIFEFYIKLS